MPTKIHRSIEGNSQVAIISILKKPNKQSNPERHENGIREEVR